MAKQYTGTVTEVIQETPTVKTIKFALGGSIEFRAGQYMLYSLEKEGRKDSTPYSIFSPSSDTAHVAACVKLVPNGFMSAHMHSLREGGTMKMMGPMGRFFLAEPISRDAVFIATGTGVSPIHSMIHHLFATGTDKNVYLFFGAKTQDEIIRRKEFEALEKEHGNFRFVPVLSREEWSGRRGHVQEHVPEFVKPGSADVYMAGVQAMVLEVKKLLLDIGFPKERVHTEEFV